jgi:integrase
MKTDSKGKHKKLLLEFTKTEQRAIRIIDKLEDFSFKEFDKLFLEKKNDENDLFKSIELNVEKLLKYDRIKTARSFVNLNSSLKKYTKKSKLTFSQITVTFLEDYEKRMLQTGHSITTVGIYLRNLRVIFNKAIENGIISRDGYPFGRTKYQIPTGKNIKKALTKEEVKKIMIYVPQNHMEAYCRDLWLFSYLANGANITDISNFTHDNIQDNFLIFIRKKTLRSNRQNPKIIRVYLNEKIKEIIDRWGSHKTDDKYIFPILTKGMSAEEQVDRIENIIKSINHHMWNVAKSLEIDKKITTYTARHTFSTVLKRSGASIEFISESLGHKNISTTEHYLDSFDDSEKERWSQVLL